jgi:hypothetical protein
MNKEKRRVQNELAASITKDFHTMRQTKVNEIRDHFR